MKSIDTIGICIVAALAFAGAASAQEAPQIIADGADVLSPEDMESLAGGTGIQTFAITEQVLTAVNSGNSIRADAVNSGQVSIGASAFSGYSGLGNFVINTGHNNNLQSSMSVNVVLAPPTGQ